MKLMNDTTGQVPAEFVTFGEVVCHLPREPIIPPVINTSTPGTPAQGLLLSVSNDGVHFGRNESFITLYDSTCIKCQPKGKCQKKVWVICVQFEILVLDL